MLEKPDLQDGKIIVCLKNDYGLNVHTIAFLPLGADVNTAVYRAVTNDETPYFVKLRRGNLDKASVAVPRFLSDLGIKQVIPSFLTQTGHLWANLDSYKVILYPFVEGCNGFQLTLSERQWIEFGAALKQFHTADIPSAITRTIPREDFSPRWSEAVKQFLARVAAETFAEPVAAEVAAFMKAHSDETLVLVERTERLAQQLRAQPPDFILCHADIHGWNLLIDNDGALYMVDWDTLIFAPKERDLMFIGGGPGDSGYTPEEEEAMFYQGYGPTDVKQVAISYYRYVRILEDIAVYCEQLFLSDEGGEDRKQSLKNVKSNYWPNGTIEKAYRADRTAEQFR